MAEEHVANLKSRDIPFARMLGIEIVSAEPDRVVARMLVRPEVCTSFPSIHGGAVMAFADTLGACGTVLNLPPGASTTTMESKTNFIGPAKSGTYVTGEATPIHRGRRTQVWQTRITNADGKLVAVVTQTQMVLEGRS
ncbi:MAG TPA: PaaI family thioesterase [Hyphomicrobiaceae bacterium]|nr:PaaI family thioesterase [Hyphomicrobiaceae bacterium]